MLRRLVLGFCTLSAGAVWALRAPQGTVEYPGAVDAVHARLADMPMPDQLSSEIANAGGRVRTDSSDPYEVRWSFEVEGRSLGEVTAFLDAVDDETTAVRVEFEPGDALPAGSAPHAVARQPLIANIAETYVAEQIGATLEGRAFDETKVAMVVATYIGSHPKETQAYVESIEALVDQGGNGAAIEQFGQESDYRPAQPMRSAQPMTDLSRFR